MKFYVLLMSLLFVSISLSASDSTRYLRIMSYNCENLFDYEHDEGKEDYEYTEFSAKHWTKSKYFGKLHRTASVIARCGEWGDVGIVCLLEIENERVLRDLTQNTQLKKAGYSYLHKESEDKRGVDVALLYQPEKFTPLKTEFIKLHFENSRPTRDILFTTGVLPSGDTLSVFVNHWPSRYGGEVESEFKRIEAANAVRHKIDSLFASQIKSNIVIVGDFNDYFDNKSLNKSLGAEINLSAPYEGKKLYNLMTKYNGRDDIGTHKFQGHWGVLDHVIVSGSLLDGKGIEVTEDGAQIGFWEILLEKDKTGVAPKRSFKGDCTTNGFSDHLPVYIDLEMK